MGIGQDETVDPPGPPVDLDRLSRNRGPQPGERDIVVGPEEVRRVTGPRAEVRRPAPSAFLRSTFRLPSAPGLEAVTAPALLARGDSTESFLTSSRAAEPALPPDSNPPDAAPGRHQG